MARYRRGGPAISPRGALTPLIVISGESNSGGYALNSQALPAELAARPAVRILDNTGLASFQDLQIGVNNLVGHAGLSNGPTHGLELGLAAAAEAGAFGGRVYLVKTGQGGSTISQWAAGQSYATTFTARVNAARTLMLADGLVPLPVVWYSQGINDAIAGVAVATWKAATIARLAAIRAELGPVPVLMTLLMEPAYTAYNAALDAICAADPLTRAVSATGCTLRDANHWDYAGMKLLASRMVAATLAWGLDALPYLTSACTGLAARATSGGSQSQSGGGGGSGQTGIAPGVATWTSGVNAAQSGEYLAMSSGNTPAGGRAVGTIDATQPFVVTIDFSNQAETEAVVVYLDDTSADDFAWVQGKTFAAGLYHYGGGLFFPHNYAATPAGSAPYPFLAELRKNGSDVDLYVSTDAGGSWTYRATLSGVLAGVSTLYVKALFAIAGSKKVKVSIA